MIAINCIADLESVEGKIKIKDSFKKMLPLDKVDLLQDWTTQIDELYEEVLKEWDLEFAMKNKRDGIVPNSVLKSFVDDTKKMILDAEKEGK